jgi:anti-sigma-K factor RskA
MRIAHSAHLDALCGEYLVGTLRGAARRRFERALKEEPLARSRLESWQRFLPDPSHKNAVEPSTGVWRRLERDLGLARRSARRGWMPWAWAAVAALVIVLGVQLMRERPLELMQVAELSGKEAPAVGAFLSRDRGTLILRAARPLNAPANRSYELWVIPEGANPVSVAVLASLDVRLVLPDAHRERLRSGATLAISTEPPGGSPTGAPTGPVILAGRING